MEKDIHLEDSVVFLTRIIHPKDLGKKTSELENAIRVILQEISYK